MAFGLSTASLASIALIATAGSDKKAVHSVEVRGSEYRVIVNGDKVEVRTPKPLVVWNQVVRSEQLDAVVQATGCKAVDDSGTDVLRAKLDCSAAK
ncbi:hypothetical protein [Sphingomonas xinjiangensis]|uniref:Uncharacterized protein n=1 Tax=Sphingomonas xinjiangensis TaxID=643568 RepID=A0A840YB67_9SPHN|nr:hypothetical protein [Sphingomonas xinjiangensis]MBB5709279.1 hypothetical protein [Sphingomonas xinjiangensis]